MHYRTVFDISAAGYRSASILAFSLIFLGLGSLMLVLHRHRAERGRSRRNGFWTLLLLLLATAWTATVFGSTYRQYLALLQARDAGRSGVAEGPVTDFRPRQPGRHARERFCVQGQCFSYSDSGLTAGFSHDSFGDGLIREGLPVRVTYVGDTIVRLEVAR